MARSILSRRPSILVYLGVTVAIAASAFLAFTWLAASRENTSSLNSQREIAQFVTENLFGELSGKLNLMLYYQEAFDKTVIRRDTKWVEWTFGPFQESTGINASIMFDKAGTIIQLYQNGLAEPVTTQAILASAQMVNLLSAMRAAPRAQPPTLPSGIAIIAGRTYFAVGGRITPEDKTQLAQYKENDTYVVYLFHADVERYRALSATFGISGIEIAPGPVAGKAFIPLSDAAGHNDTNLWWTPERPGDAFLAIIWPLSLLVLAGLVTAQGFVVVRWQSLQKRLYHAESMAEADTAERLRLEDNLRSSDERFRSIFGAVSEGILIVDAATGTFIEVNEPAATMYGYTTVEMVGLEIHTISSEVPPYTQSDALKIIERAAATGQSQQFDWHGKCKDGRLIWVDVSIRFAFIDGRQVILSIARDVTERRAMEAQLRQALKMEAIGTLAGGVAHELNNLLQPIIMMTELVLAELPEESSQASKLLRVIDAGGKAAEIVQRILAFGRADEVSHSLLNLGFVAREAISFIRTILPSSIALHIDMGDAVSMVRGDKTQLTQVLINLATNARDAIGANIGSVWVSLSKLSIDASAAGALKPGSYAVLTVRDTGAGMDKATAERIFEPFFTTKAVGKGTGLGLSVTHGIIAGHGGTIQVESIPGRGTTFLLYLPIAAPVALALTG